jgi:hypothetical protein
MRIVGHDIHRGFAEAVAWENGKLKRLGRIDIAARSGGGPCIDFVGGRLRGSKGQMSRRSQK